MTGTKFVLLFFKLLFERYLSVAAATKQLGIHVRTAQKWAAQYEKDPDSIFEKWRKTFRPRILHDEHKSAILECIDENPSIVLDEVMKKLKQMFTELKVSKTTLLDFVKQHCNLSLKKARLQPIDRNSEEKVQERLDWGALCSRVLVSLYWCEAKEDATAFVLDFICYMMLFESFEFSKLTTTKYPNVELFIVEKYNNHKLELGTKTMNVLITSSIQIDKNQSPAVGPSSTNGFSDSDAKIASQLFRAVAASVWEQGENAILSRHCVNDQQKNARQTAKFGILWMRFSGCSITAQPSTSLPSLITANAEVTRTICQIFTI
ncbi:Homeodomain-like DNA binding domain-containing transcription factor [Phycomyces blakesleeanus NRRL 1555(-)]|uniref:Homeodomain-like DNA binding domain-containing transcription factor n=1 Tax=Phycomyces blakesleeanus (strain ATCC 8743b / DSM 1359 / FGSC 10004 / NBRC 33097 / NRRL 1555) TaxID=763407 RepID=A0A162PPE1_PHYB8|nr:Homeodomain-like DNA binding domain-containing transcription factor [Phycomyces blakesleeanus NRRL 1555(-)]OAD71676.1 Homeodomain-like DNA binding domain-containing transcription factor [Phycomyces blakesleeanus NRRL 1555(-)]|eukprot:XP_018289716.1 Homeodomain-like DNA binding domain-containing transcription factor [Phycomyces blakesleeanus NRRL 1555(-)]